MQIYGIYSKQFSPSTRWILESSVIAIIYAAGGYLGFYFASIPPGNVTSVWPGSGIALAFIFLLGYRAVPGIWLGSFICNIPTLFDASSVFAFMKFVTAGTAIGIGSVLQPLFGAFLIKRFTTPDSPFDKTFDTLKFAGIVPIICLISASIGNASLYIGGYSSIDNYNALWTTWWIGDSIGILIFFPLILGWSKKFNIVHDIKTISEAVIIFTAIIILSLISFNSLFHYQTPNYPFAYLPVPFLLWIAIRFGLQLSALSILVVSGIAIWGTTKGFGPFVKDSINSSLLLAQLYIAFISLVTLLIAAFSSENKKMEKELLISEERFRTLIHRAKSIIILLSPDHRILEFNKEAEHTYGVKKEDAIGKNYFELLLPQEFHNTVDTYMKKVLAGEPAIGFEIKIIGRDGKELIISWDVNRILDSKGQPISLIAIGHNLTERKKIEDKLKDANKLLDGTFSSIKEAVLAVNPSNRKIISCNQAAENIFGYKKDELIGCNTEFLHVSHEMYEKFGRDMLTALDKKGVFRTEFQLKRKNGEIFPVENTVTEIVDDSGLRTTIVSVIRDIKEKKYADEKIKLAAKVIDNAIEGIMITDQNAVIQSVNPAFTVITGYTSEEVVGKKTNILKSDRHGKNFYKNMWNNLLETGQWSGEIWNRRKNGEAYPERLTITAIKNDEDKTTQYASIFYDITEIKQNEMEIEFKAYHDALTELPNRQLFYDRLKQTINRARRKKNLFALLFIDLDNLKKINDSIGHLTGDLLLQETAGRLVSIAREGDTVARLGGDEFVVILDNIKYEKEAAIIANRIIFTLSKPFNLKDKLFYISASIGITLYPENGETAEDLIKKADIAMYHVKNIGKNNYQFFSEKMNEKLIKRVELETNLRKAWENRELVAYYQPIVNMKSGNIISMEALARWPQPKGKFIPPSDFIPVAEENGLILEIDEFMLEKASLFMKRMKNNMALNGNGQPFYVSVNLSAIDLENLNLYKNIAKTGKEFGLNPEDIVFEITESMIISNIEKAIFALSKLRDHGFGVAIDDFGTGYSSLNYLAKLPVNILKIDRSFVMDLPSNKKFKSITKAILSMSHELNIKVVAEGVETQKQLDFLRSIGCDHFQGYIFSPPVSEIKMEKLLKSNLIVSSQAAQLPDVTL